MMHDLRFALRQLLKAPGFTVIAVLTLAVAIGVNTAIFALVNSLLLKPVVTERPEEVVNVYTARKEANRDYRQFSHQEFELLRQKNDAFRDVAAMEFALAGVGEESSIRRRFAFLTSENVFALLGTRPALGRFYNAEECRPNANIPVVVISHSFWKKLGGSPAVLGSSLRISGRPFTIIGVTARDFRGLNGLVSPDLWLPLGTHSQVASAFSNGRVRDLALPENYTLNLVGRLAPDLTVESAQARLPALETRLTSIQTGERGGPRELQLQSPSRFSISTSPSDDGPMGLMGVLFFSMAAAVLLIACLNLANMLLARGAARAREMAVRLAVGASRWRIVRQLLCEGFLLALLGGALGLLFSVWGNSLLFRSMNTLFSTMDFSIAVDLTPDGNVILVTFLFCLVATLFFSLGPALKSTRVDLVHDLKQQAETPASAGRVGRFFAGRHLLVMSQIALSLVLLFSAGLFLRGALKAGGLQPGFDPNGGLVTDLDFSLANTAQPEGMRLMFAALEQARQFPGIERAALADMVPYGNFTNTRRVMPASAAPVVKTDPKAPDPGASGLYTSISSGYFHAIGVKLLRGRDFTAAEAQNPGAPPVAIIDEEMTKKLFPNEDALGQRIRYTQTPTDGSPAEMEVVGIVASHRHEVLDFNTRRRLYVPLAQTYAPAVFLHTRTSQTGRPAVLAMINPLRELLRQVDPDMPVLQIVPFIDRMERDIGLWAIRVGATLFGIFGGIALLLAMVGVYGVKAYAVARRTREIGIRMALGADRRDVFALIMKQGVLQTLLAVGIGIVLALAVGRLLAQILFQVSPADPASLIGASLMLSFAALIACLIPARRATRVTPMTALRTE